MLTHQVSWKKIAFQGWSAKEFGWWFLSVYSFFFTVRCFLAFQMTSSSSSGRRCSCRCLMRSFSHRSRLLLETTVSCMKMKNWSVIPHNSVSIRSLTSCCAGKPPHLSYLSVLPPVWPVWPVTCVLRSYLDMMKVIIFCYMFWFVLTIIFITGTTRCVSTATPTYRTSLFTLMYKTAEDLGLNL